MFSSLASPLAPQVDKKGQPGGDALLVGGHAEPLFVATVGAALLGGGVALGLLLGGSARRLKAVVRSKRNTS